MVDRVAGRHLWLLLVVSILAAGCGVLDGTATLRPTPIPAPPTLRPPSTSMIFDGRAWTLSVIVDPHGLPTDVVLEWGEPGAIDRSIPMADDVEDAGVVTLTTRALPIETEVCFRYVATNAKGSATLDGGCHGGPLRTESPSSTQSP